MASYGSVKEKLKLILNTEKTINFLKNVLNGNGFGLANATPNLNRFLKELAKDDDDIKVINNGNRKRTNNDIEIYNKKIFVCVHSVNNSSAFAIFFKGFRYEKEENVDYFNVFNEINDKLDSYDYIFLIRAEEEETAEDRIKACYYYYLFPAEIFKIDEIEKINFAKHKKRASLSSRYWTFKSFSSFYLKYNDDLLMQYNVSPSLINC